MAFNQNWRLVQTLIDPGVAFEAMCHVRVLMKISELLSLWLAPKVALLISNQSFRVCFNDMCSNSEWKFSTGTNVISILFNIYLMLFLQCTISTQAQLGRQTTSCTSQLLDHVCELLLTFSPTFFFLPLLLSVFRNLQFCHFKFSLNSS